MGHLAGAEGSYAQLQQRLIQKVHGATESPVLMKILTMLFSSEQAELAAKMPNNLASLDGLAKRTGVAHDELKGRLTEMARQGLVFDIELNGRSHYALPPIVIGLFEFIFMRARPDMPMRELAALFDRYFREHDGRFSRGFLSGKTQQFRTLVCEETIPRDSITEILGWERATEIVSSASCHAVGLCQCHHAAQHLGKACDKPAEICLSFDYAAESLARNGIARKITRDESLKILQKSKEAGLAQTGDNVRNKVTFICNCCGCCCHLMQGIKNLDLRPGIITSNFILEVDAGKCRGCGACARVCPVGAIVMKPVTIGGRRGKRAVGSEAACLGCGVCAAKCPHNAAVMRPRPNRILVPEDVFEQRVMMAVERGKLAELIFDDPAKLSHRALGRVAAALERTGSVKAWMAAQSLNSAFLKGVVKAAKRRMGPVTGLVS
jgi:ferredoxin